MPGHDLRPTIEALDIDPKCQKYVAAIGRKKRVDLDAIGTPANNNVVEFLKCQTRATKLCVDMNRAYEKCHSSVMGTGNYQGKKHCGEELEKLLDCANNN